MWGTQSRDSSVEAKAGRMCLMHRKEREDEQGGQSPDLANHSPEIAADTRGVP
jgi:hypothetical protein